VDRHCVHRADNDIVGQVEELEGLGADDAGAIHRLADDGVLLHHGNVEAGRRQPLC
jgi:hypothetical protein